VKKITLIIDDDVYQEVKSGFGAHCLAGAYGIVDAFTGKLIKAIDQGKEEETFSFNKKAKEERGG